MQGLINNKMSNYHSLATKRIRKASLFAAFIFISFGSSFAQISSNILDLKVQEEYDNIHVVPLHTDSLVSSFVIWIKQEVKPHKHELHTEQIYVLEGVAIMKVGQDEFTIKAGSFIFIPKSTIHSVVTTSSTPLKVLSVQAPKFVGEDRVFATE